MKFFKRIFTTKSRLLLVLLIIIFLYIFTQGFILRMGNSRVAQLEARIEELLNETSSYKQALLVEEKCKSQQKYEEELQKIVQLNTQTPIYTDKKIPSERFYDVLFHLKNISKPDLNPRILLRSSHVFRSPPRLVIGIPTIYREKHNYLIDTIKSLFENIQPEEKFLVKFVVLFAEMNYENAEHVKSTVELLSSNFKEFIHEGLVEAIMPPEHWYPPDLKHIAPTFNDSQERMFWRTKQCLDYVYLMIYARYFYSESDYYVQLEDDVITVPGYTSAMIHFATTRKDWLSCDFSALGFIGKLFRVSDLPLITDFTLLFYREKPVDWIFDQLFLVKYCHHEEGNCIKKRINGVRRLYRKPPLFQHVGHFSSLTGKTQNLKEKSFKKKTQYVANVTETKNPQNVKLESSVVVPDLQTSLLKFYQHGLPFIIEDPTVGSFVSATYEDSITVKDIMINFAYTLLENASTPFYGIPFEVSVHELQSSANESDASIHNLVSSSNSVFYHVFNPTVSISKIQVRVAREVSKLILYSIRIS